MFDRRLIQHFDWVLLGLTLVLAGIGILTLYSAVNASAVLGRPTGPPVYLKQLYSFGVATIAMVVTFLFNYKLLHRWGGVIYGFSIVLLLAVLLAGKEVSGSQRWLMLGPLSFQPSEIAKITVAIVLARYFSDHMSQEGFGLRNLWKPLFWCLIPFLLIARQPDLGTGLVVLLIAASMTLFVKVERRAMICLTGAGVFMCSVAWFFLKEYQKQRIAIFVDPGKDPLGAGYHIIQSKIAVGSGMFWGKGFLEGTQNALSFLPEQHTDFIFSVLAEEWGFLGSAVFVGFYVATIVWGLSIAMRSKEPFGTVLAVGITSMLFWQAVINVGMALGLLPVVGVPLPLISYGGSSLLVTSIGIGILMNISMRRFMFKS
jgi:rod shape determining protein RodA